MVLLSSPGSTVAHVGDEVLDACRSLATVLPLRPPFPNLLELQAMVGKAACVVGRIGVAPQAMAKLLQDSGLQYPLVLAIDDADTLPRQTLYYLSQVSNAFVADAPALQLVFGARPALLKQLGHPDFKDLAKRIAIWPESAASQGTLGERTKELGGSYFAKAKAPLDTVARVVERPVGTPLPERSAWRTKALELVRGKGAVAALAAISFLAIGIALFMTRPDQQLRPSGRGSDVAALQNSAPGPQGPLPAPPDTQETDKLISLLVGAFQAEMERGLIEGHFSRVAGEILDRIDILSTRASAEGLSKVLALKDRILERSIAAIKAGRFTEARQIEQYLDQQTDPQSDTAAADAPGTISGNDVARNAVSGEDKASIPFEKLDVPRAAGEPGIDRPAPTIQRAVVARNEPGALAGENLPNLAPPRIVLVFHDNDAARGARAAAFRQVLIAARMDVAESILADVRYPQPGIYYYFVSDRDAAIGISRRLEPLLGSVEPRLLARHDKAPPPGTIEIAVP